MGMKLGIITCLLLFMVASAKMERRYPELIQQVTTLKALEVEMYVDELPKLTKIDAVANPELTIGMYMTTQKFHRDLPLTTIFGYGLSQETASFPGPVIEAERFISTFVTWENHLPATHILPWDVTIEGALPVHGGIPTVVHLHGGAVPPADDGHALAWYTAGYTDVGPTFDPSHTTYHYPNVQHGGNLVYHDHAIGLTRINLLAGLFGAYNIREPLVEAQLNLPSGEEFDRHLIIADRSFNADGSLYMNPVGDIPSLHPSWNPEYFGDANTVNGKVWPYLNVQRRKYRFRILNASNARFYRLSFVANGVTYNMTAVGSDTSYLPTPASTNDIILTIAETFDVVFDFSLVPDNEIELVNDAPAPFPGAFFGQTITGPLTKVMKFIIDPLPPIEPDTSTVPAALSFYPPALESEATTTRFLAFYEYSDAFGSSVRLLINGKRFSDPVTETPRNGTTEVWNVINLTNDTHPLHIHLVHFQSIRATPVLNLAAFRSCMQSIYDPVLCDLQLDSNNSRQPFIYERTWKNIIKIPAGFMATVIVKFSMVSGAPFPFDPTAAPGYVYHCHILDHEDNEMIRPLVILP